MYYIFIYYSSLLCSRWAGLTWCQLKGVFKQSVVAQTCQPRRPLLPNAGFYGTQASNAFDGTPAASGPAPFPDEQQQQQLELMQKGIGRYQGTSLSLMCKFCNWLFRPRFLWFFLCVCVCVREREMRVHERETVCVCGGGGGGQSGCMCVGVIVCVCRFHFCCYTPVMKLGRGGLYWNHCVCLPVCAWWSMQLCMCACTGMYVCVLSEVHVAIITLGLCACVCVFLFSVFLNIFITLYIYIYFYILLLCIVAPLRKVGDRGHLCFIGRSVLW